MAREAGYNIYLKQGSKTFVGVTSDELSISANTKESTTKDTPGTKKEVVTSHKITFKVSGLIEMTGTGSTKLYNDDIIAMALSKQTYAVTYHRGNGTQKTGTAIVMGYSESSSADPDSDMTYSLDFEIVGTLS